MFFKIIILASSIKNVCDKALLLCLCLLPLSIVSQNFKFNHGGLARDYIYYSPNNLPANAPLVFVLHGYSGSAWTYYI